MAKLNRSWAKPGV